MSVSIYTHPDCVKHEMGPGHPESPQRIMAIEQALKSAPWADQLIWKTAPKATTEQLQRVHPKHYIDHIFSMAPTQGYNALDPDTIMNPFTLPAALHAAGAIIAAVDDTFAQRTQKSFCLVRPPGHHAEPDVAMGFCFFNNVAIGVKHAMAKYNCQRIAIIDFDVHHGNGTHTTFMNEPRVFFWSSFQHPFYPGVSLTNVSPNIHLCPLNAGTNSAQYRGIITKELLPALEEFKPEIIFISAGFDAHQSDPLANIQLTTEDYAFITHVLCKVADKTAQGRIISTLEGGYNLPALGASAAAHVGAMLEPS